MPYTAQPPKKRRRRKQETTKKDEHSLINPVYSAAMKRYPKADGFISVKFLFKTEEEKELHRFRVNWVKDGLITFSVFVIASISDETIDYDWKPL